MTGPEITPPDDILTIFEQVLSDSPADETELVWLEVVRSRIDTRRSRREPPAEHQTTVLIRVEERGRTGSYRTGAVGTDELAAGVRQALGQARTNPPASPPRRLAGARQNVKTPLPTFDPELSGCGTATARRFLEAGCRKGERASLRWSDGRLLIANTRGLRQHVPATAATLEMRQRRRAGAGRAVVSSRSLLGLEAEELFARCRRLAAPTAPAAIGPPPSSPVPVLLAPEAVVALLRLLNRRALSATSFHDGSSYLLGKLGEQAFEPAITLRDDGTDPAGLPFPFDLSGFAKRPVDLVVRGVVESPAVDQELAARLGHPPTPHALGDSEAQASNLFLATGQLSEEELLERAEGGIRIGWLERLEDYGAMEIPFRAMARGVRRVAGGELREAVDDLLWEDHLARVFGTVAGLGAAPVSVAEGDGFLGGISAPALILPSVAGLRPTRI